MNFDPSHENKTCRACPKDQRLTDCGFSQFSQFAKRPEMIQFSGLTLLEVLCVSIGKDTTSAASSGM